MVSQHAVGGGVALIADDDARGDGEEVVGVVPLLALGLPTVLCRPVDDDLTPEHLLQGVLYVVAPQSPSDASPPGFVYGIVVSLFLFFNVFALNQWLQYRGRGRWGDYLFGERVYIVLSLVAKSLLAWQVFGGTLAG